MTEVVSASDARLVLTRRYAAPRQTVFRAWTQPEHLKKWFAPSEDMTIPLVEMDLRVGGRYRIGFRRSRENDIYVIGVFHEVNPPAKLAFSWGWEEPYPTAGIETFVTVELREIEGGTELVLTHERFPNRDMRDKHNHGWNGNLDRLAKFLASA